MNASPKRKLLLIVALAALGEISITFVLCNARPHAPLGFYLWFGGLTVAFPIYCAWLYRVARRGSWKATRP